MDKELQKTIVLHPDTMEHVANYHSAMITAGHRLPISVTTIAALRVDN